MIGGVRLAYDGRKSMYTARPLAGLGNEPRNFDITLTREDGAHPSVIFDYV